MRFPRISCTIQLIHEYCSSFRHTKVYVFFKRKRMLIRVDIGKAKTSRRIKHLRQKWWSFEMTVKEVPDVLGTFLVNNILAHVRCFGANRCLVSSALNYRMNRRFKKPDRTLIIEFVDGELLVIIHCPIMSIYKNVVFFFLSFCWD